MKDKLLRFDGAVERDPEIEKWLRANKGALGAIARRWFDRMRKAGDEVRELMHDDCATACLGDAPFASVGVYTSHVNVSFFHGADLPDPADLLRGTGKHMRHIKLRSGVTVNEIALRALVEAAYADIKSRVEHG
jgi:hypothetical protein